MLSNERIAREERGTTLIETLVAIVTGLVVLAALFAILEVSLRQSVRLSSVAQASQLGRTAMNHVVDELHSTCVAQGASPIEAESSENKLILVNGYGEAPEVANVGTASTGGRKDEIIWSPVAETLVDKTYYATGGSASAGYTFSSTASPAGGTIIGEHIAQVEEAKKKVPIFRYYAYATTASTSTTAASSQLNEAASLAPEGKSLEAATAATVASVVVTFQASPNDTKAYLNRESSVGRSGPLSTQVTFAFRDPGESAGKVPVPCE